MISVSRLSMTWSLCQTAGVSFNLLNDTISGSIEKVAEVMNSKTSQTSVNDNQQASTHKFVNNLCTDNCTLQPKLCSKSLPVFKHKQGTVLPQELLTKITEAVKNPGNFNSSNCNPSKSYVTEERDAGLIKIQQGQVVHLLHKSILNKRKYNENGNKCLASSHHDNKIIEPGVGTCKKRKVTSDCAISCCDIDGTRTEWIATMWTSKGKNKHGRVLREEIDDATNIREEIDDAIDINEKYQGDVKKKSRAGRSQIYVTPDHFIALQITNPKIHTAIKEVQKAMISKNADLVHTTVPLAKLHITVIPISLPTKDHRKRAKSALELCGSRLHAEYNDRPMVLDFTGIGNFRDRVVFAKVACLYPGQENTLQHVFDKVTTSFLAYNIKSTDSRELYTPHVTIAKLFWNCPELKEKGVNSIDKEFYKDFMDKRFGCQLITSIQLCSMSSTDESTGYYNVLHQVQFGPREVSNLSLESRFTSEVAADILEQWNMESTMKQKCLSENASKAEQIFDLQDSDNEKMGQHLSSSTSDLELDKMFDVTDNGGRVTPDNCWELDDSQANNSPKTQTSKQKQVEEDRDVEADNGNKKKKKRAKKPKSPSPDHFIALQINNPEIHSGFDDVQAAIVTKSPDLVHAMVSVRKLHITVMPVCLPTEDHINRAKSALELCATKLQAEYCDKLMVLDVSGIGNFRNNVIFAKASPSDSSQQNCLQNISDVVNDSFEEYEIKNTDKKSDFKPHITIAKLSRNFQKLRNKGIKKIDPSLYEDHIDRYFGHEVVTRLQLCSMFKQDKATGYYKILHQVNFGPQEISKLTSNKSLTDSTVADILVQWSVKSAVDELVAESGPQTGLSDAEPKSLEEKEKSDLRHSDDITQSTKDETMQDMESEETEKGDLR